ncbi:MAG: YcxB family protein [Deltaproteobacteria bacterium]|nr:YcxB family protein [Deltaproteobacteria bacterium]
MSIDDDAGELIAAAVTRLEEEDFVRAYREVPGLRRYLWQPLAALALVGVAGGAAYAALGPPSDAVPVIGIAGLAFLAWIAYGRRQIPRTQWRSLPEHAKQLRFEIRRHRFRTRTERSAYELVYEDFYSWHETEHALYLEQHPNNFVIVPKSAFASAEEIRVASEHLARSIVTRPQKNAATNPVKTLMLWALLIALLSGLYALVRE